MNVNERTSLLEKTTKTPSFKTVVPQTIDNQHEVDDGSIMESTSNYTQTDASNESTTQSTNLSDSSLSSIDLKDETNTSLSSIEAESSSSSLLKPTTNAFNQKQQNIAYNSLEDSSTDNMELQNIPDFDKNRSLTKRERAIIEEQKKELSKQKAYTNIYKLSWKNLSFLLCYSLISITGFFYPFNAFENLMQSELGIIPCNVSFILSCGTGCFFICGGYYGIFYDRYGCAWGLYIGAIFSFIGNMCLSASFQHIIKPDMLQLSLQSATVSSGYGMIYVTCLLVILKSAANRHRGKVNGFAQALWMMGAYSTPKLNSIFFKVMTNQDDTTGIDAKMEGEMILFKGIWAAVLIALGAFLIKEEQSKWYFHRDYKYTPYFKTKYDKSFTMKQFKDIQFLCFMGMGSCMLCACYLYPSQISLILGSFNERSYVSIYKKTISYLAAGSSLITGIGIDLLKWHQRPAMFMFVSIFMILIANCMLIFNMYNMLLTAAGINGIAMGIFWACYPLIMSDIYGLSNLGTNLGISFVLGGLICGYLQTAAGEWYAQTIEDNDITCHGAPCFREVFVINQFLICLSFVFLMTLSDRRKEKHDFRGKGVLDVKYLDNGAEKDFMQSRMLNKDLFGQKPDQDAWHDNELIYGDENGEKIFSGLIKDRDESLSPIEMEEKTDYNAGSERSNDTEGILFSDEMVAKLFENVSANHQHSKDDQNLSTSSSQINDDTKQTSVDSKEAVESTEMNESENEIRESPTDGSDTDKQTTSDTDLDEIDVDKYLTQVSPASSVGVHSSEDIIPDD